LLTFWWFFYKITG